jgi:hypothetical protein
MGVPEPAIYLLIGFPGAGKYTVACELARQLGERGRPTKVVDNHYVNNPIFGLLEVDGRTRLPDKVWDLAHRLREVLLDTVEHLSPKELSFVFTNFIGAHESEIADPYVTRLRHIAEVRGAAFRPVLLNCDPEELGRRVPNADRAARMKWTDGAAVAALTERVALYAPEGCESFDTTHVSPAELAGTIIASS